MGSRTFEKQYVRTLDTLSSLPASISDVWLFESRLARQAAEIALGKCGRNLRIHSAYKTLLHTVREQNLFAHATDVCIRYPVVEQDDPSRFRLECYPLQDIYADINIRFLPSESCIDPLPSYHLTISTATQTRSQLVEVPVRWKEHPSGRQLLVATGWMKSEDGDSVCVSTDYEQIYDDACSYLQNMSLVPLDASEPDGPYFEQLNICVTAPFEDEPLPVGNEVISLAEAMHEEIYFTSIEIFQQRLGLPPLSRELKPGQVIPRVSAGESTKLSITATKPQLASDCDQRNAPELSQAAHWLYPWQVKASLYQLNGKPFVVSSRQGRVVEGRHVHTEHAAGSAMLAISAGQHANESSGVVASLRAAQQLQQTKCAVSFTVCPVENADGYALYHSLCLEHANHMHHAARYTASGNDLTCGGGFHESAIRQRAYDALPARVHVNLHGYPAHEWTRPLSGYIPYGFSRWTIPKGFFLICNYASHSDLKLAKQVLNAALSTLYDYPELMVVNKRMLHSYERAVGSLDFQVYKHCIPYTLVQRAHEQYPITLITEAPDESVYGEDFRIAHEAHYRVIMAVANLLAG